MASVGKKGELVSFPDRAEIKNEAGVWIARLDQGPLAPHEIDELRHWVARSADHRDYLLKMARNWDAMSVLEELADIFPLAALADEESQERAADGEKRADTAHRPSFALRMEFGPTSLGLVAGAVVVCLIAAVLLFRSASVQQEFATAIGEQARYTLQDGTVVALNTNSRISIDYAGRHRAVMLIQGEAGFEVSKDPERPFVVYAGSGRAEAIGTAFNVRLVDDQVDVTVIEGLVRVVADGALSGARFETATRSTEARVVDEPGGSGVTSDVGAFRTEATLGAGQSARYGDVVESLDASITQEDLDRKLAWHEQRLIFDGQTLAQALDEIARYTEMELIIADPSIAAMRVGGHYKTDDIEALLAALSLGFGIKIDRVSEDRVELSAN